MQHIRLDAETVFRDGWKLGAPIFTPASVADSFVPKLSRRGLSMLCSVSRDVAQLEHTSFSLSVVAAASGCSGRGEEDDRIQRAASL